MGLLNGLSKPPSPPSYSFAVSEMDKLTLSAPPLPPVLPYTGRDGLRLPMEVLLRVLEAACATDEWTATSGLDPENSTKRRHVLRKRYRDLRAFCLVCRAYYATCMPKLWEHAVFFPNNGISRLQLFEKRLTKRSPIVPTAEHPRWHRYGCYVRVVDLSFSEYLIPDLEDIFDACPKLERVHFNHTSSHMSPDDWRSLYASLSHLSLVSLRNVTLPHSKRETAAFLDLLSDIPQLEEFSAESFCLQADLSASLIEIFKMNYFLPSHKTGIRGAGLRDISFGQNCDLPFTFIQAIPRACLNLRSFHILAGANITTTGSVDLDLLVSSFPSSLRSFTFLADASIMFTSSFDRILESQPLLEYLHLRADFISLDFFLRSLPGVLQALKIDLAAVVQGEGEIDWHLSLHFPSRAVISASVASAREFRRQGLGWTAATPSAVRTQLLRRLLWTSEWQADKDSQDAEGGGGEEEEECACSDEEGTSESDDSVDSTAEAHDGSESDGSGLDSEDDVD